MRKSIHAILTIAIVSSFVLIIIQGCNNSNHPAGKPDNKMPDEAAAFFQLLKTAPSMAEDTSGKPIPTEQLKIERTWDGERCKTTIKNVGATALHPANIILFNISKHGLNPASPVYGEGFQMLAQKGGTLDSLVHIGTYPDETHYKIPNVHGLSTAYGVLTISPKADEHLLLGFTSCNRFIGRISYDANQMLVSFDTEGLELQPGQSWQMEDFIFLNGNNRSELFEQLAAVISKNHPSIKSNTIPTGWCSWYCYGPDITQAIMQDNLDQFSKKMPSLKYIQLDDGYEPFVGDWLDKNPAYGDLQRSLQSIRDKGFEPAIWVAPFVAEKKSRVLREHPDWFIKDTDGSPLVSSKIGFGGWRHGPWYALDGTNPQVQEYLQKMFEYMRKNWGVNYFKLDANYWVAIHGGIHYDKNATRIEAYRRGMEAVLKGCDKNTVVLGCNAPIWPSIGLVTAMRTSNDINRDWATIKSTAFENLNRGWQNGKLWNSDSDCVLLAADRGSDAEKSITPNEWMFHATAIHAVGGLMLSGDKAANLGEHELSMLKKLLQPTGKGAHFLDAEMRIGVTDMGNKQYYYFFNWSETDSIDLKVQLPSKTKLTDFWTDTIVPQQSNEYIVKKLPPHAARLIVVSPAAEN